MLTRTSRAAVGGLVLACTAGLTASIVGTADATAPAAPHAGAASATTALSALAPRRAKTVSGRLNSLNNSGVTGDISVRIKGRKATVRIKATGLARNLPHAQHIHFSAGLSHRCPTNAQDANGDGRINVAEGSATYGAIVKSLTTKGDSSPNSALAVDRFPAAPKGKENYKRTVRVKPAVARAIRNGNAIIIVHGVDYNGNGQYDLGDRGPSEIAPSLPAEATDPAACGRLR